MAALAKLTATSKASAAGTTVSGNTPVRSRSDPDTGLTVRAVAIAGTRWRVTGRPKEPCAPPLLVSPTTFTRPSCCKVQAKFSAAE
jgi:hypothetical protein